MNLPENYAFLPFLTVSEFKSFKRSLATLQRSGVSVDAAVDILIAGFRERRALKDQILDAARERRLAVVK